MHVFVVPAFNEEANLPRLLLDLEERPRALGRRSRPRRRRRLDRRHRRARRDLRRAAAGPASSASAATSGPGRAFDRGFRAALELCDGDDDLIVTLEADTTSDLDAVGPMLARARAGADVVLASVHGGGALVGAGRHRVALSRAASFAVRRAAGLDARTVSSFFRVYRAGILRRGYEAHGALVHPRGRLRLQGRDPGQARPPGRPRRGGARSTWTPRAGWARASCGSCPPSAATRASWRASSPSAGSAPHEPAGCGLASVSSAAASLGLATALRLVKAGVAVTVYERDAQLGGLAGTTDLGGIPVDRYYHVVLPTDDRVRDLAAEVGLGDDAFRFRRTGTGFFQDGRLASMSSARELLTFPGLRPVDKARLAAFAARCQLKGSYDDLEGLGLEEWLRRRCGARLWDTLWRPLLDSKFDGRFDDLPATYLWARSGGWPARATARRARSWGRSRAATRCSSTRSRTRSAPTAARSCTSTPRALRALRGSGRALGVVLDTGMRSARPGRDDAAAPWPRAAAGAASCERAMGPDPTRYLGVVCLVVRTRRSRSARTTRVNITDRSRPAHDGRRDDARRRPRARRRHAALRPQVRRPGQPGARAVLAPRSAASTSATSQRMFPAFDAGRRPARRRSPAPASPSRSTCWAPGARRPRTSSRRPAWPPRPRRDVYPDLVNGQAVLGVAERLADGLQARLGAATAEAQAA